MSYAAEWEVICERFRTQWAATPIHWFDQPFTPPADGSPWVRISIQTDEAAQVTLGAGALFRSAGVVAIQVFLPVHLGPDQIATDYLDPLCAIWRGFASGGVRFRADRAPHARRIGPTTQGYLEWQVIAPYRRDTVF